jgi:hypothetical protein
MVTESCALRLLYEVFVQAMVAGTACKADSVERVPEP